jgi:hypothetical protein
MTRALPSTNFNSSRLIRLLADLSVVDVAKPQQDFAERLGEWLDVGDAITLSAALNCSAAGLAPARSGEPASVAAALSAELARLRTALTESITTDGVFKTGKVRIKLPTPAAGATPESAADFAPWHRYYQAHQRDMESNIGLLRNTVRATLSNHSPALRQIAELDAAFVKVLSDRERSLLAMVPSLLEKRFGQLRRAHLAATVDPSADDPTQWLQPGGWLAGFCRELQQVLLAELDLRLQAVIGLIEAFSNEVTRPQ